MRVTAFIARESGATKGAISNCFSKESRNSVVGIGPPYKLTRHVTSRRYSDKILVGIKSPDYSDKAICYEKNGPYYRNKSAISICEFLSVTQPYWPLNFREVE